MKNPVGAPTELTEGLKLKIRDMVIEGIDDIAIAEKLNIPINTFKSWKARNYHSFADNYEEWKLSRLGQKALGNVEPLLTSDDEKIKADMTKFVLSTLKRKAFSTRSELTGADGGAIETKTTLTPEQRKELSDEYTKAFKKVLGLK